MNEMPGMNDVYDPFLLALESGVHSLSFVEKHIVQHLQLPEEIVQKRRANGSRILVSRVTWAACYFVEAGFIERTGYGLYRLSNAGQQLADEVRTGRLHITYSYLMTIPSFADYRRRTSGRAAATPEALPAPAPATTTATTATTASPAADTSAATTPADVDISSSDQTPEDQLESALAAITNRLEKEILDKVCQCDEWFFEQLVLDFLVKMGYSTSDNELNRCTSRTRDGGIDAIVCEDKLGFSTLYAQAKRYAQNRPVRCKEVRDFAGALIPHGPGTKGIFITTSDFTQDALDYASQPNMVKLILLNGQQLAHHMVACGLGVATSRSIDIKRIDNNYFNPNRE